MKYCTYCVMPSTRPNIVIAEEGICNACQNSKKKKKIDWPLREQLFRQVVLHAKSRKASYDCIIPVSGGKDSTWQVVTCLEHGLRPLAVSWRPPGRTSLGQQNLDNLISLGVDHIDYQINPVVEKKFMYLTFMKKGSHAIPMHLALFHIPLRLAISLNIPLVVWGENSAFEYGGREEDAKGSLLDNRWIQTYGATHGENADDWVCDDLSIQEVTAYRGPTDRELQERNIRAIFLGYYFQWDPVQSFEVARAHGFQVRKDGPHIGYYDFADIDDAFMSIHHYIKWFKFGMTRSFDNLSLEIRNGRMTRSQAIDIIRQRGDETPDEDIEKFCAYLRLKRADFFSIVERFRNPTIWSKKHGTWMIEDFLIPDWKWV